MKEQKDKKKKRRILHRSLRSFKSLTKPLTSIKHNCVSYFPVGVELKRQLRGERRETDPSIRNCPGEGRPKGSESFSRASRDGQLSTKLDTGILVKKPQGIILK